MLNEVLQLHRIGSIWGMMINENYYIDELIMEEFSLKDKLMQMLEERKQEIIEIRRYLHENPELSFEEEKTSKYIEDFYEDKDVHIETKVGGAYGIIVTINGGKTR